MDPLSAVPRKAVGVGVGSFYGGGRLQPCGGSFNLFKYHRWGMSDWSHLFEFGVMWCALDCQIKVYACLFISHFFSGDADSQSWKKAKKLLAKLEKGSIVNAKAGQEEVRGQAITIDPWNGSLTMDVNGELLTVSATLNFGGHSQ